MGVPDILLGIDSTIRISLSLMNLGNQNSRISEIPDLAILEVPFSIRSMLDLSIPFSFVIRTAPFNLTSNIN